MASNMLSLPVVDSGAGAVFTAALTAVVFTDRVSASAEEGGSVSTTIGALETTIHIPFSAISKNATLAV